MATHAKNRMTQQKLGELLLWEKNYNSGQVEQIVESIAIFGFNQTVRVWRGTVMAGNHAIKALRRLKDDRSEPPEGITVVGGEWLVPCLSLDHLSESQAKGFAIADNEIAKRGRVDDQVLRELLDELAETDPEAFDATGYSLEDLEALTDTTNETDPENKIAESSETATALTQLRWGRQIVQITEEESLALDERLEAYLGRHGTSFGFGRDLLGV